MNCYVIYKEDWGEHSRGYVYCKQRTAIALCFDKEYAIERTHDLMEQAYKKGLDEDTVRYNFEEVKELPIVNSKIELHLNEFNLYGHH